MSAGLSPLHAHILLALSLEQNLLLKVPSTVEGDDIQKAIQYICHQENVRKTFWASTASVHIETRQPLTQEDLLESFVIAGNGEVFESWEDGESIGSEAPGRKHLPQVLLLPNADQLPQGLQAYLKVVLREKKFNLRGESYILPRRFCLVACVGAFENLAGPLIDDFGLSLSLEEVPLSLPTISLPIIPTSSPLYAAPPLKVYVSDLLSHVRHHPLLQARDLSGRCSSTFIIALASAWVKLRQALQSGLDSTLSCGEVRPQDVKEVFLSAVGHRVRWREMDKRLTGFWRKRQLPKAGAEQTDRSKREVGVNSEDEPRLVHEVLQEILRSV